MYQLYRKMTIYGQQKCIDYTEKLTFRVKQKCIDYIEKWPFMVRQKWIDYIEKWPFRVKQICIDQTEKWPFMVKQKCIDNIEKWPFMVIFLYNLYNFVWIQCHCLANIECCFATQQQCLFVLRFYGPVNPMGSCWARLLGRLCPLSG